ncbi:MAG: hypothetical protein ABJE80_21815 [Reichenbachiella sp.]|uniref:hypothetical protein n=1 Tax=Reichenbachiella sp. TaxID=2184521 RepID=UPI003263D03E
MITRNYKSILLLALIASFSCSGIKINISNTTKLDYDQIVFEEISTGKKDSTAFNKYVKLPAKGIFNIHIIDSDYNETFNMICFDTKNRNDITIRDDDNNNVRYVEFECEFAIDEWVRVSLQNLTKHRVYAIYSYSPPYESSYDPCINHMRAVNHFGYKEKIDLTIPISEHNKKHGVKLRIFAFDLNDGEIKTYDTSIFSANENYHKRFYRLDLLIDHEY